MKALSIRQPWAWLIIRPDITDPETREFAIRNAYTKDIENRSWPTKMRGRILVHAAKGMTLDEYDEAIDVLWAVGDRTINLPSVDQIDRGGIIGTVDIVDCITRSASPWFFGPYGFVLSNPQPLPFLPMSGRLGFFDVEVPA